MSAIPENIRQFVESLGYDFRSLTGGPGFALVPRDRGTTYVFRSRDHVVLWCAVRMSA